VGPYQVVPLTAGELNERISKLTDHLDHFGDVKVTDLGQARGRRRIEYFLAAPGVPDMHDEVVGLYREWFQSDGDDWEFVKYTYEYLDKLHGMRLAYHLHSLRGLLVPHAHCGRLTTSALDEPDDDEADGHLRAVPVELKEANGAFMQLYANERPPDCSSFLPLALPRP
jgi:hypothetical protein